MLPGRLAAPASLGEKTGTKRDEPVRVLGDRGFRPVASIETAVFAEKFQPLIPLFCPTVDVRHKTGTKGHSSPIVGRPSLTKKRTENPILLISKQ